MKSLLLVALSAATATATMALAMDDASAAARRSGVNRAGVNAGGINRYPGIVVPADAIAAVQSRTIANAGTIHTLRACL